MAIKKRIGFPTAFLPPNYLKASELEHVVGQTIFAPVDEGEMILQTDFRR